jgi:hypothetical protein
VAKRLFEKDATIMKIGRREHLKQLGLGAAGVLTPALFEHHVAATQQPTPKPGVAVNTLQAREWPWTSSKPTDDNPGIRLVFAGVMLFTYKRTGDGRSGRVVFHRGSGHKLQIIVVRTDDCATCPSDDCVKFKADDIQENAVIDLAIPQRRYDDVVFYQTGNPNDFERKNWYEKDFRWLLDLEGPETFNNKNFNRSEGKGFNTKLRVQSGRFYTYQRTNSTFKANVGTLKDQIFNVAKVMACDIWLADEETLELKIPGKPVQSLKNPAKYEVYFLNSPDCDPCERSDFPMVFDAVEDGASYKFDLQLEKSGPDEAAKGLCLKIGGSSRLKFSDEAPCMGGGFGGGRGFP